MFLVVNVLVWHLLPLQRAAREPRLVWFLLLVHAASPYLWLLLFASQLQFLPPFQPLAASKCSFFTKDRARTKYSSATQVHMILSRLAAISISELVPMAMESALSLTPATPAQPRNLHQNQPPSQLPNPSLLSHLLLLLHPHLVVTSASSLSTESVLMMSSLLMSSHTNRSLSAATSTLVRTHWRTVNAITSTNAILQCQAPNQHHLLSLMNPLLRQSLLLLHPAQSKYSSTTAVSAPTNSSSQMPWVSVLLGNVAMPSLDLDLQ